MSKSFRVKKNGDSLQVFDLEGYAGSISLKELCRLVRNRQKPGTGEELAQVFMKE